MVQSGNCSFRGWEFGFPNPFHDVSQPPVTPDLGSFMVWLLQAPTCSRYTHPAPHRLLGLFETRFLFLALTVLELTL